MLAWMMVAVAVAEPYAQGEDLLTHMEGHFAAATDASWFVALGDLASMRTAAQKLDHEPLRSMPREWRADARKMQKAAREVVAVQDVASAAPAVAALGGTCASCHTTNPAGPRLTESEVKMEVLTPIGQHALAPYWLWVGFVMNSDAAWQNGAKALVGAPIARGTEPFVPTFDALAASVKVAEASEREALMGQLLGTCKTCHDAAGVTVEP